MSKDFSTITGGTPGRKAGSVNKSTEAVWAELDANKSGNITGAFCADLGLAAGTVHRAAQKWAENNGFTVDAKSAEGIRLVKATAKRKGQK